MLYLTWKEILYMADYDFNSIFELYAGGFVPHYRDVTVKHQ